MSKILFLCDKKACDICNKGCKHTSDIKHAINFENVCGDYIEKERNTITFDIKKEKMEEMIMKAIKELVEDTKNN